MFYLARWSTVQDPDTNETVFVPSGWDLAESWACIDLRPDCAVVDGFCILRQMSNEILPSSAQRIVLTDDPNENTTVLRQRLENRLSINLTDNQRFRRLILRLLFEHGDDDNPARWNRLRPNMVTRRYEVMLGGLLDALPIPSGGAVITDDFNRADNADLGANWTPVASSARITSNCFRVTALTTPTFERYDGSALATADHYCQVRGVNYDAAESNNKFLAPCCRFNSGAYTCYLARRRFTTNLTTTATMQMVKRVAGAETTLSSAATIDAVAGEIIKLEVNGSSLKAYLDGVEVTSIATTDTSITGNVNAGLHIQAGGAATRIQGDDWEAGDISSTTPIAVSDSVAVAIAGAVSSLSSSLSRSDSVAVAIAESRLIDSALSRTDSVAVAVSEATSKFATIPVDDSVAVGLADVAEILVAFPASDGIAIAVTDTSLLALAKFVDDAVAISIDPAISDSTLALLRTDDVAIAVTEAFSSLVSLARSDSLVVVVTDSGVVDLFHPVVDSVAMSIVETSSLALAKFVDDAVAITIDPVISDAMLSLSRADSVAVAVEESRQLISNLIVSDLVTVGLVGVTSSFLALDRSDSVAIAVNDVGVIFTARSVDDQIVVTIVDAATKENIAAVIVGEPTSLRVTKSGLTVVEVKRSGTTGLTGRMV